MVVSPPIHSTKYEAQRYHFDDQVRYRGAVQCAYSKVLYLTWYSYHVSQLIFNINVTLSATRLHTCSRCGSRCGTRAFDLPCITKH